MNSRTLIVSALGLGAVILVIAPVVYFTVHRTANPNTPVVPPSPATVSDDDRRAIEEGEKLRQTGRNPPKPTNKVNDPFPLAGDKGAATRP